MTSNAKTDAIDPKGKNSEKDPTHESPFSEEEEEEEDSEGNERTMEEAERELLGQMKEPIHMNPHGVYRLAYLHKARRERELAAMERIPPKKVGSLRDGGKSYTECSCRKGKCLMLYCECFQSAKLCNSKCSCDTCHNETNTRERHQVILQTITENPNAFRPMSNLQPRQPQMRFLSPVDSKACTCRTKCNDTLCPCFDNGARCDPKLCKCTDCLNHTAHTEIHTDESDVESIDMHRENIVQVPEKNMKSRIVPAFIEGMPIQGLAFSKTGKRLKRISREKLPKNHQKRKREQSPVTHELMLGEFVSENGENNSSSAENCEPGIVKSMREEIKRAREFFSSIGQEFSEDGNSAPKFDSDHIFPSMESTIKDIARVMTQAKGDILERREEEKSSTVKDAWTKGGKTDQEDSELFCAETLPSSNPSLSDEQLDTLSVLAVKDTVIIREATRYINQITRELYEQRQSR